MFSENPFGVFRWKPDFCAMSLLTVDSELGRHLRETRLLAVVAVQRAESAEPLAQALLRGGIDTIELTLRTPQALQAIENIATTVPEMTVAAGTILNETQVDEARDAGAQFGVSPSVNPSVLEHAKSSGLPFSPGIMTPTDIDVALQAGCDLLKFFPATSSGGISHLQNIAAPYAHLGLQFIPLGGINAGNLPGWLACDKVAAVGGSWIAPSQWIDEERWDRIESSAREAREIVRQQDPTAKAENDKPQKE